MVKDTQVLPRHVAIIMDGNGRWAAKHNLPRLAGHYEGVTTAHEVVRIISERGIPYITLFTFSTENWKRPQEEVSQLLKLMENRLEDETKFACEMGIRLYHLGRRDGLPSKLRIKLERALELTRGNTGMRLALAYNYGSRDEIIEATRRILQDRVQPDKIDANLLSHYLYSADFPDPDLIIRTGGEIRLSNFLLWQAAYAELYFTPVLWPDFDQAQIDLALAEYSRRERRFGSLGQTRYTNKSSSVPDT